VCPRCGEMDKLVVYSEKGKDFRECVSCGFQEEMRFQNSPRELDTRVNRSDEEKLHETTVVKVLDSDKTSEQ
jgi:uncharacterized protein